MCTRPVERDGNTFACRTCDECLATRRHNWVARAMAEKTDFEHVLCVALTYSDETEHSRQGAQMFCYADVRAFMARLRSAARRDFKKRRLDTKPVLRFLCAGEQGDRFGRCHWHLILYSNFPVWRLGEVKLRKKVLTELEPMLTRGKKKRRLHWSMWSDGVTPTGFVTFQEPDEGGMNYVLSYCLKDQFTEEKSKDTMREAKSENFATGLFRMSKRPAIGEAWLYRKLEELASKRAVLPSLNLRVPDLYGYWQPSGLMRERLLWGLVALNKRIVWATGANAPQWASLLASCKDNEKDLEVLINEKEEEEEFHEQLAERARRVRLDHREHERARIVKRCGREVPCESCLAHLSAGELDEIGLVRYYDEEKQAFVYDAATWADVPYRQRRLASAGRPHGLCRERDSAEVIEAFGGNPERYDGKAPEGL